MTVGGVDGGRFQVQEIAPFVRQDIFQIPRAASSAFTLHIAKLAQPPAHLMDARHIRLFSQRRVQPLQPVHKQAVSFGNSFNTQPPEGGWSLSQKPCSIRFRSPNFAKLLRKAQTRV